MPLTKWESEFGVEYTNRNPLTCVEMDTLYEKRYGITRTEMDNNFLGSMDRSLEVLEVGCGGGVQLEFLKSMGFINLTGLELGEYPCKIAQKKKLSVLQGNVLDMPFSDGEFDLVFTSGLLIHISPVNLLTAISEIVRCSRKWIWGFEYYSPLLVEMPYRGEKNMLWKRNYPAMYSNTQSRKITYYQTAEGNTDVMFLLEKVS